MYLLTAFISSSLISISLLVARMLHSCLPVYIWIPRMYNYREVCVSRTIWWLDDIQQNKLNLYKSAPPPRHFTVNTALSMARVMILNPHWKPFGQYRVQSNFVNGDCSLSVSTGCRHNTNMSESQNHPFCGTSCVLCSAPLRMFTFWSVTANKRRWVAAPLVIWANTALGSWGHHPPPTLHSQEVLVSVWKQTCEEYEIWVIWNMLGCEQ